MRLPFLGFLLSASTLITSGCGLLVAETSSQVAVRLSADIVSQPEKITPQSPAIAAVKPDIPMVTVTRYKIDRQCNNLVPEDLDVAAAASLEETIETIVGDRSNGDFRIAGYRMAIDESTKTATIDFRLPIDSPRSMYSLSHCEQLALLGELRQTLVANADWNIDIVTFQVQGQNLQY
ncbi:hypothetical protein [[Limnothrix rosea] IAM M-220]|uniref:hypothetical protein n=1 Tax=[Limnothrix rosea] IAM M-220 TaxID=454133 RepID=UPI0009695631|nr:hypothetical protein [[Limnothrix rosea] IAM M-220]OKH13832.1 hypothetical protein NIES208_14470 [[Limnothrix rosea] IAM M-220]